MIYKIFKTIFIILIITIIIWGFSASYSSHNIDNIVHVVAIGIDKYDDPEDNMKVSFQFVNLSSNSEGSSSGDSSTVITSIITSSINKAINLMNSYIGKELNFSHCKVIVFSKDFAKDGIYTEICTMINNEEIRPSTNIIISTSDANIYLKNSNPNIEKLVTNYYDTFELTSNFTGYSDDTTIGNFYNKLFGASSSSTAILGRTFQKVSASSLQNEQENTDSQESDSSESANNEEKNYSSSDNENNETGKNSGGDSSQNDTGGGFLEISGKRGTQNVGIAVFKNDKYIGQLSEIDSICHLLITNNVSSFVLSVPIENSNNASLDLNFSPSRNSKIKVDTDTDYPNISISVYCDAKILTSDKSSDYSNYKTLENISKNAELFLKEQIESYLSKTSKEFVADISGFANRAKINFLTIDDWNNYNWLSKYSYANFSVDVDINVTSSLLFSGN